MQHVPALHIEPVDFVGHIQHAIEDFRINRARAKAFKKTVRELSALTDCELSDIGLARSEIISVARQSAI
ncbi:MAG: DUF1127 domain-containing protein [Shimia sp.]|uniref:DUF1127 domain-containing protein n=1 Tax=Shimia sp. TaxID=1954381 RepID=UPI00405971AD